MVVFLVSVYHACYSLKKNSYFFLVVWLLFACVFLLSFICFMSHMSEFDALMASRSSF